MRVLEGLEPVSVFYFFEEICKIPHISYHEQALSDYCVAFAKERKLFYQQDELGNVLIIKEATSGYEKEPAMILQGHLDMVGEKVPDCELDLEKDPIRIRVDGDYICAEGTTLGGDDGIAVAYALAVLDAKDIPHPRLEVVLTVSEEVGLLGATGMDLSLCQGKRLINVDSEVEGVLTAGCAGGVRVNSQIPVSRETKKGLVCELFLEGLKGGHSGMEIDKGRANANVLLGRFLLLLKEKMSYGLLEMKGGAKENVIPKDGGAVLLVDSTKVELLEKTIDEFHSQMKAEYGTADPNIHLNLVLKEEKEGAVLDEASLDRTLKALNLAPDGVQAMSMDLPGMVETSLNLGVLELAGEILTLRFSIRSSIAAAKEQLVKKLGLLTELLGGNMTLAGDYPSWPYARESRLRDLAVRIFKEQYGKELKIEVIHAGLECGILSSKIPGLDCISIGPDMVDIHTPKEKLSISSVARTWKYLLALLAEKEA